MKKNLRHFLFLLCFIFNSSFLFAQDGWLWGRYGKSTRTGVGGLGDGNSVTIDPRGNCFLTGLLEDVVNVEFGPYTLVNNINNTNDAFIVKFDKNGNLQWAKQTKCFSGLVLNGYITSIDGNGNAYLVSNFQDTLIIGSDTLSGLNLLSCVIKFDPNGNVLWAKQSNTPAGGTLSSIVAQYVSTDKNGNSFITGTFNDTAIFGDDTIITNNYGNNFLVKYDADGNVKWAKASESPSETSSAQAWGNTVDNFGNIYLTGYFFDTVYLGMDTLMYSPDTYNMFLAKYDSTGNVKWVKQTKNASIFSYGQGYAATCDQYGNVYVTGEFEDTLIFDKDTLISSCNPIFNFSGNYTNFFVAKYDSAGNFKWAVQDNTPPDSYGTSACSISSDTMGHIYVSGGVGTKGACKLTVGKDTLITNDTSEYDGSNFILKFDTGGNLLCANIFPYGGVWFNSIASDPTGNYVYYGSSLLTEALFGQDTIDPWSSQLNWYPIIARWEECDKSLGVPDVKEENGDVRVYPNPSNGIFTIQSSVADVERSRNVSGQWSVEVYNVMGEKVTPTLLPQSRGGASFSYSINLSGQPNGVYFYRVLSEGTPLGKEDGSLIGSGKLVIQK